MHYILNQFLPNLISFYQAGGHLIDNEAIKQYTMGRLIEYLDK